MDGQARCKQGHRRIDSNHMVVTVTGSSVLGQLLLWQSLFQYDYYSGPHSRFNDKTAPQQHKSLDSLLSRPCWGNPQSKVPMPTTLSLAIKSTAMPLPAILLQCRYGIVIVDIEWIWGWGWMQQYPLHTSLIYVEKIAGYKMVITALAKKTSVPVIWPKIV